MIATTVGLGPFKPAIRWYDRVWVTSNVEFESEDEACTVADGVVSLLNARAAEYMTSLGYMPQERG